MKADRSDAAAYFAVNRKTSDVVKYEDVVRYFAVWRVYSRCALLR